MHCKSTPHHVAFLMAVLVAAPAWASDACDAAPETWQPRPAVHALAARKGWQLHKLKIDDGCYEIKGRDAEGRRFKAKIDPATLEVVHMKRENGHRARDRDRDRDREGRRGPG
jgi:hypothetical protein